MPATRARPRPFEEWRDEGRDLVRKLHLWKAKVVLMALLALFVDFLHALLMVAWVVGMPLLFWHRWPRLSHAYAIYAIAFVIVNVASGWILDECFLTTVARVLWRNAPTTPEHTEEWFTVRFSELVFHLTPSHRSIKVATKVLILTSAVGTLYLDRKLWRERRVAALAR
jgi:hypothetical protein